MTLVLTFAAFVVLAVFVVGFAIGVRTNHKIKDKLIVSLNDQCHALEVEAAELRGRTSYLESRLGGLRLKY